MSFVHFLIGLGYFLLYHVQEVLYILGRLVLHLYYICRCFLQIFIWFQTSYFLCEARKFYFYAMKFINVYLNVSWFLVITKKAFHIGVIQEFTYVFFQYLYRFIFYTWLLTYLKFILLHGMRYRLNIIVFQIGLMFIQQYLLKKTIFIPVI